MKKVAREAETGEERIQEGTRISMPKEYSLKKREDEESEEEKDEVTFHLNEMLKAMERETAKKMKRKMKDLTLYYRYPLISTTQTKSSSSISKSSQRRRSSKQSS